MIEVRCQRGVPGERNGLITQGSKKLQITLGNRKWLTVAGIKRWGVKLEGRLGIALETKTESETVSITPRFLSWVVV